MTTLEAVNEILESIGEPPVSALDTAGSSDAAEAERFLNRYLTRVLEEGWEINTQRGITITLPTHSLTIGTVTGTFVYGETVTVGAATATFSHISGTTMYVYAVTGTLAPGAITGGTSGATATAASVATSTSSSLPFAAAWLKIEPASDEWMNFVRRGSLLYDTDDVSFTFYRSVKANVVITATFDSLTNALQRYVIESASFYFERFKKRGQVDGSLAADELIRARSDALQEDGDSRRTNILNTSEAYRFRGGRSRSTWSSE